MEKYTVVYPFRDLQDKTKSHPDGRKYAVGDTFPATQRKVSDERVEELRTKNNKIGKVLIKASPLPAEVDEVPRGMESYPQHTGGGYYELSDGSKVQGKEKAEEAEKKLGD